MTVFHVMGLMLIAFIGCMVCAILDGNPEDE